MLYLSGLCAFLLTGKNHCKSFSKTQISIIADTKFSLYPSKHISRSTSNTASFGQVNTMHSELPRIGDVEIGTNDNHDDDWDTVKPRQKPKQNLSRATSSSSATTKHPSQLFMILLVGLPGSGKSFFAQRLVQQGKSTKFVRINQDTLKTRKKCESLCRRTLLDGNIPIIDRCNFDTQQRSHFLAIAKEMNDNNVPVEVDCITFQYSVQACITRCKERTDHETINKDNAKGVVLRMNRSFRPPSREERQIFRSVREVTQFCDADNITSEYINDL